MKTLYEQICDGLYSGNPLKHRLQQIISKATPGQTSDETLVKIINQMMRDCDKNIDKYKKQKYYGKVLEEVSFKNVLKDYLSRVR